MAAEGQSRPASGPAFVEVCDGHDRALIRADVAADLGVGWAAALWSDGAALAGAVGRGGVTLLRAGPIELVARDLRRGGLLARLLPDAFPDRDRSRRELEVLAALRAAGVACVPPVAALARRSALGWRQRLVTERVRGAQPLPAFVAAHPERRTATVEAAGRLVARAFAAGLRHPDLHPENVLAVAAGAGVHALLVDLDKARLDPPLGVADRDGMLVRMARFGVKHRARLATVPSAADQLRFLRALGLDRGEAKRVFGRLASDLATQLARRRYASSPSKRR